MWQKIKKSNWNKKWLFVALGVVISLGVAFSKLRQSPEKEITLKLTESTEAIYGLASVQANRVFNLKLGVSSNVRKLYVGEGDTVRAGDRLVDFDDFPTMRTPIAGTVVGVYFKAGESVFQQNKVITVLDLTDRQLTLDLEEQAAILVKRGQKVRVSFDSIKGKNLEGTVRAVYPYEGQFRALLTVPTMPSEILPGMTADVAIEIASGRKGFFVPAEAIENNKVTIRRDGKRIALPVQAANAANNMVEIQAADLKEGDAVVYPNAP